MLNRHPASAGGVASRQQQQQRLPALVPCVPSRPAPAQCTVPPAAGLHAGHRVTRPVPARGPSPCCSSNGARSLYTSVERDPRTPSAGFDTIEDALADIAAGKFVVVLDDEDRENEGDLIAAADKMTPEAMAYMVEYTSGVICISMEGGDLDRLKLPLMINSAENEEAMYTAFTVTVDARHGISTGISAEDRTRTVRMLADPATQAADLRKPGHIFPLRYRPGGVIVRPGHTEAAVDLARLAGCHPSGVLCEIVNKKDGSMARTPELMAYARAHGLKIITIADLIRYRLRAESLLQLTSNASMDTRFGAFTAHCFRSTVDGTEHMALVKGNAAGAAGVMAALHYQSPLKDVFGSASCGGRAELDDALKQLAAASPAGVLLYVRSHASAAAGLSEELRAYGEEQAGCSTSGGAAISSSAGAPCDVRDTAIAAQMLRQLGVASVRLLAADGGLAAHLQACGVAVTGSVPLSNGTAALNGMAMPQHAGR